MTLTLTEQEREVDLLQQRWECLCVPFSLVMKMMWDLKG